MGLVSSGCWLQRRGLLGPHEKLPAPGLCSTPQVRGTGARLALILLQSGLRLCSAWSYPRGPGEGPDEVERDALPSGCSCPQDGDSYTCEQKTSQMPRAGGPHSPWGPERLPKTARPWPCGLQPHHLRKLKQQQGVLASEEYTAAQFSWGQLTCNSRPYWVYTMSLAFLFLSVYF